MAVDGVNFDTILENAVSLSATDIHLCAGSVPLFRINGTLAPMDGAERVKNQEIEAVLSALLTDEQRARLKENRVLDFSFSKPGLGRFRANVYSQRGSYAIAVRILPFEIPQFDSLGLPDSVRNFTTNTKGLFLATGATGSGKSTTLSSLLDLINIGYNYHIITIEDPIEYLHNHKKSLVTQREIGQDADNFASALRSALREDPDVIMVGEMRDPETISIALTAAETGHLVLSTLHTMGVAKSIDRMVDAFPPTQQNQIRSQLATVLKGIVSQQLIPRSDKQGMVAASEVMFVNNAIRNLIREGKHYQINSILQTGQDQGMQLLEHDLAKLFKTGVITEEEMNLRSQDVNLLQQFLSRRF